MLGVPCIVPSVRAGPVDHHETFVQFEMRCNFHEGFRR